jgi:peptide deformylase
MDIFQKTGILDIMTETIKIYQEPEKVLRKTADTVSLSDIGGKKIQTVIADMRQALLESGDGVAIAAPQIGQSVRIFLVAGYIFDQINNYHGEHASPDKVFINPEIIKASKTKKSMKGEGCLSVRFVYGVTKRSEKVTVKATDENGNDFIMPATGLLAQIFQHEIDHLNGILFIDHASDIGKMEDSEIENYEHELIRMREDRMKAV